MEIFNYPVVLIDIMIVMPLEASLTNRFKPAATFVEDVLVHVHSLLEHMHTTWAYTKLTQQCFGPYANTFSACTHYLGHKVKGMKLVVYIWRLENSQNSEDIYAYWHDFMIVIVIAIQIHQ